MALTKRALAVPASPPSVRLSRLWVGSVLRSLGRDDLVDAGELGVTELVTNAILHAEPPLTVQVRGTVDHPRIEVTDNSSTRLVHERVGATDDDPDMLLATFGRGLDLVAMNSAGWGVTGDHEGVGKTVWFEPAAEPPDDAPAMIDEHEMLPQTAEEGDLDERLEISLLGFPAALFGHLRRYHFELRREMRLLALSDPDAYPIARALTELFEQAGAERRVVRGVTRLDEAIRDGVESIDLDYVVPATAPDTMGRALQLFTEVRTLFAEERLLAMTPGPELVQLQEWYFTEFIRQARGEPPRRWTGPTQVLDGDAPSA